MNSRYKKILVAVDGSNDSEKALDKAIELSLKNKSTLIIGHVVDYKNYSHATLFAPHLIPAAEKNGKSLLNKSQSRAHDAGLQDIIITLQGGNPQKMVAHRIAEHYDVDLIVIGRSGVGTFEQFITGSVALSTVRQAACDVLIISNEKEHAEYRSILVAIDGSDNSLAAFENAVETAKANNGRIMAVHVINTAAASSFNMNPDEILAMLKKNGENIMQMCKQIAVERSFENIDYVIERGSPKTMLPGSIAEECKADLIVAGTSGLNYVERQFLGSVSERIVLKAPCDVLIVHPPE